MRRLRVFRHKEKQSAPVVAVDKPIPITEYFGWKKRLHDFYFGEYKKLLWIPIILLVLALAQIGYQVSSTGDFIIKGVSLQGGVTVSFNTDLNMDLLKLQDDLIRGQGSSDIVVRRFGGSGVIIEAGLPEQDIDSFLELISRQTGTDRSTYSIEIMGSALGKSFFRQAFIAMVIAFVLMGLVVLVIFRNAIPSLAIMVAAFADIVIPLAILNLLGVKIQTAGIAAFLMLIGYAVDTNILLTIRVLKRKEGSVNDRIISSMKTGMTMTFTAIASTLTVLAFSTSQVLTQIMFILFLGLATDLIFTWIMNVSILKLYLDHKERKHAHD